MITYNSEVCLITVPHTGAHFVIDLLGTIEIDVLHRHWLPRPKAFPLASKFLITARDPYLTALRYIYNGDSMEDVAKTWKTCLFNLYNIEPFIIDIGCRAENRLEHICDALRFIDIGPEPHMEKLKPYVEVWKPLNTTEGFNAGVEGEQGNKAIYLETGKLPDGYDWSLLDDAVDWYRSLPTNDHV